MSGPLTSLGTCPRTGALTALPTYLLRAPGATRDGRVGVDPGWPHDSRLMLTLVIPAHNEARLLPRLLDSIEVARARYAAGPAAVEVIVADNGSTDETASIARARGCRVVPVVPRLIAAARNGGAAVASGAILAFVDADSEIHPDTFNAIERALGNPRIVGGATGVRPDRWSPGLVATYMVFLPFVFLTGMDTGVVFCRREDFVQVGGYDERREIAEDVAFLWALKRLGWSRGQRLTRLRSVKAMTSTRKFDRYGDWHYLTTMPGLAVGMILRPGATRAFIRRYWYQDRE